MNNKKEFRVLKSVYTPEAIMKAAYMFLDRAYIHFQEDNCSWIVQLTSKEEELPENIDQEFENTLLAERVREITYRKTSDLRKIILARAMASSVVSHGNVLKKIEALQTEQNNDELLNILTDWFYKNGK